MKFKPEDFATIFCTKENEKKSMDIEILKASSNVANAKLEEWLSAAHDVYGNDGSNKVGYIWTSTRNVSDTHKAKLVQIVELK